MLVPYTSAILAIDHGFVGLLDVSKRCVTVGFDILDVAGSVRTLPVPGSAFHSEYRPALQSGQHLCAVQLEQADGSERVRSIVTQEQVADDLRLLPGRRCNFLRDEGTLIEAIRAGGQGSSKRPRHAPQVVVDPWLAAALWCRFRLGDVSPRLWDAVNARWGRGVAVASADATSPQALKFGVSEIAQIPLPVLVASWQGKRAGLATFIDWGSDSRSFSGVEQLILGLDIELAANSAVRELGVADAKGHHLQLLGKPCTKQEERVLASVLQDLAAARPLIVGHNVWQHDIRHIREQFRCSLGNAEPVWDTLWMSFLLDPSRASHALVNSQRAHVASFDAAASTALAVEQMRLMPHGFVGVLRRVLDEGFHAVGACVETVVRCFEAPARPKPVVRIGTAGRLQFCEPRTLARRLWDPGMTLDEQFALSLPDRGGDFIDSVRLRQAIEASNPARGQVLIRPRDPHPQRMVEVPPELELLVAFAKRVEADGLRLFRQMVPTWLKLQPSVVPILDLAGSVLRAQDGKQRLLTPQFAVEAAATGRAIDASRFDVDDVAFVGSVCKVRDLDEELPESVSSDGELETVLAYELKPVDAPAELGGKESPFIEYATVRRPWFAPHGRRTTQLVARLARPAAGSTRNASAGFVRIPEWITEVGWDDDAALWPISTNRFGWWSQVAAWLMALAAHHPERVLLVTVPDDIELDIVEQMLSEPDVGLAAPDIEGSRLRRLEHALAGGARCIVVPVGDFGEWLDAARSLGVASTQRVQPVLLHVPFEFWGEWSAPRRPSGRAVQESGRVALERFMGVWLTEVLGCAGDHPAPICLDYRVALTLGRHANVRREECPLAEPSLAVRETLQTYAPRFGLVHREPPPTTSDPYRRFLKDRWGYQDFLQSQQAGLEAIISSNADVLVTLPTGEGKSVLFQVPALLRSLHHGRLSIIVTPLRALMQDQVRRLKKCGFRRSVDYITADRDPFALRGVYQGVSDGTIRLLYIAPERFQSRRFRRVLQERARRDGGLEFIVFDEAHCLSEWGFQFRPDYLRAIRYVNETFRGIGSPEECNRVLLFSATVTRLVQSQLKEKLREGLPESAERPFVAIPEEPQWPLQPFIDHEPRVGPDIVGDDSDAQGRLEQVRKLLGDGLLRNDVSSAIVFVARRRDAEQLAGGLASDQLGQAEYFHAAMGQMRRRQVYEEFRTRRVRVLAATCAFGMGMDVPHIHRCVHLSPPQTVESMVQEIGRMGRDAKARERAGLERLVAYTLHTPSDFAWLNQRIERGRLSGDDLKRVWEGVRCRSHAVGDVVLSFVPADWSMSDGDEEIRDDKTRLALFWLEECGCCRLEAMLPAMLEMTLSPERLLQVGRGESVAARIARVLTGTAGATTGTPQTLGRSVAPPAPRRGMLATIIDSVLGFFFGPSTSPASVANRPRGEEPLRRGSGEFNLIRVMEESGLSSLDEVLQGLRELEKSQALQIERDLRFEPAHRGRRRPGSLDATRNIVDMLLERRRWTAEEVRSRFLGNGEGEPVEADIGSDEASKVAPYLRCDLDAAVSLLVGLGVLHEDIDSDGRITYRRSPRFGRGAKRVVHGVVSLAASVQEKVGESGKQACVISLSELLRMAGPKLRTDRIRLALALLNDLGLSLCKQDLLPMTYVMTVQRDGPVLLPHEDPHGATDATQGKLAQLFALQDLAELRCAAVEVLLNLEDPEERRKFIESYFRSGSVPELEAVVESALENVPDPDKLACSRTQAGKAKLKAKRGEALAHLIADLRPATKQEVVKGPHDRNYLVNAGPGSGKTHLLEARVAFHVHASLRPENVMLLAFNRAVVSEIRERVRTRFDKLGFGQYGRRVQCFTFHGLAERHLRRLPKDHPALLKASGSDDGSATFDTRLQMFAELCETDNEFARKVMQGVRMVLVDEFQDLDAVKYRLLRALARNLGIAVTAVGDDDQDIVGFTRAKDEVKEGIEYFRRFSSEWNEVSKVTIDLNMRSVPEVVDRASQFIKATLGANRTKLETVLRAEKIPRADSVIRHDGAMSPSDVVDAVERLKSQRDAKSIAVLCRTNSEAHQMTATLRKVEAGDLRVKSVIGASRLRLVQTRQWWELLEAGRRCLNGRSRNRLDESALREVASQFAAAGVPESIDGESLLEEMYNIVAAERGRPTWDDVTEIVEQLTTTDLVWLGLKRRSIDGVGADVVVTVVHRVKGLEFDAVVIPPSTASFPLSKGGDLGAESREEARVLYVGMTRAKNDLVVAFDGREKAWFNRNPWQGPGSRAKWLDGDPKQFRLNASGESRQIREYVRASVREGDAVEVRPQDSTYGIWHGGRNVGVTSQKFGAPMPGGEVAQCRVVALFRFEPRDQWLDSLVKKDPSYPGWHYVPLVQGHV
jgi:superfamily II DNA helicase RecQ/superfamily I DNA/RNA helicase